MGTININTTTSIISVTSDMVWGIRISSKTNFGLGATGVPSYPYFAASKNGSLNDTWDVSFLDQADYLAELFEQGMGVVDQVAWIKTNLPAENHLECVSGWCQRVNGIGNDQCIDEGIRCDSPTHKACITGICQYVDGVGTDECQTRGVSCNPPTNYAAWGFGIAGVAGLYYLLTRQTARVRSGYEAVKREYGRAKTSYKTLRGN